MEPGAFETIPQLTLQRRRLVQPGSWEPLAAEPVPRARELAAKGLVSIVDLDGLQRNKADLDTLRKCADKGNVWADAGSRFATDAMDVLVAGAERITMRWSTLAREEELRELAEMSDAVWLGLEHNGAFVPNPLVRGDEGHARAIAKDLNLGIVVIDLARTGTRRGFDKGIAARFDSSGLDRWFTGGVRDTADAREVEAMGYRGCLVGAAWEDWR
ncbi:MAG: hypothetical protein LC624_05315 [Halobacteriales archaeon]|nr:hypothetical protein [Halobacteriales archaeon]